MHLRGIIAELLVSRSVQLLGRMLPWHLAQLCGCIKPQFCVTWCPTFQKGHVISCLVQDAALRQINTCAHAELRADSTRWTYSHVHTSARTILLWVFLSSATACPLFNTTFASLQLPTLTPKLPFRDVTGCHGNCLLAHSPPTEGAATAAVDQLDSVARQQVTWCSLATTLLQEPANPLNLSLAPSPNTLLPPSSLCPSSPKLLLALLTPKTSGNFESHVVFKPNAKNKA